MIYKSLVEKFEIHRNQWYDDPENLLKENPFKFSPGNLVFSHYASPHSSMLIVYIPKDMKVTFQNKISHVRDITKNVLLLFTSGWEKIFENDNMFRNGIICSSIFTNDLEIYPKKEYKLGPNETIRYNKFLANSIYQLDVTKLSNTIYKAISRNKIAVIVFKNDVEFLVKLYIEKIRDILKLRIPDFNEHDIPQESLDLIQSYYFNYTLRYHRCYALNYNLLTKSVTIPGSDNEVLTIFPVQIEEVLTSENIRDLNSDNTKYQCDTREHIASIDDASVNEHKWEFQRPVLEIIFNG